MRTLSENENERVREHVFVFVYAILFGLGLPSGVPPQKKNDSSESWRACWERRKGTFRELIWKDLWTADMAFVMKKYFFKPEYSASKFGHLPKMALASKGMMASLMASSFCERINSCANIVVTKDNSLLSDEENLRRSTRW